MPKVCGAFVYFLCYTTAMLDHETLQKIREEERRVRSAVKERLVGYVLAALGLVAGLAWNDAIKSFIDSVFPATGTGLIAKFVYAAVLTLFIAVAAYYLSRLVDQEQK